MFRALRPDEIELRIGTVSKKGTGFSLLCYKDARCDQNILDEVYGSLNWQRVHKDYKGVMYCGVGIYNNDLKEWVWKWDCGEPSKTSPEKGEASDSFKRACFNIGIGRELYTSPFIWISGHMEDKYPDQAWVKGLRVADIQYEESETKRTIIKLVIKDKDNKVAYSYGSGTPKAEKAPQRAEQLSMEELIGKIKTLANVKNISLDELCAKCKVDTLYDMDSERLANGIEWLWSL